jgi:hypothetical protein
VCAQAQLETADDSDTPTTPDDGAVQVRRVVVIVVVTSPWPITHARRLPFGVGSS